MKFQRLEATVEALTAENERLRGRVASLEAVATASASVHSDGGQVRGQGEIMAEAHTERSESVDAKPPPFVPPPSPPSSPSADAKSPMADSGEPPSLGSSEPLFSILFQQRRREQQRQQQRMEVERGRSENTTAATATTRPLLETFPPTRHWK